MNIKRIVSDTQALRDLLVKVECNICHGSRQVKVGWSPINNIKIRVEYDPCPNCTPGPHSFHAKQTADHLRALIEQATP